MFKTPVIIVNFKLYRSGVGKNALHLARVLDRVANERGASIIVAVNPMDAFRIKNQVKIPVILQHVDAVDFGAHTGRINLEVAREYGIDGVLVNHSERMLKISEIDFIVEKARDLELESVVCANNSRVAGALAFLSPNFIAMEPPELIGGNISVSTARPEAIVETIEAVKSVKNIPVLVGAGIKNRDDVKKALDLGADGVLVASGIVKAKDPENAINDLIEGMM